MKRILTLTIIAIIASSAIKAQTNFQFVSQQHQQVKYDTANKAYFVDSEVNSVSKIRIQDNALYFVSTDGSAFSATKIALKNADLAALANKTSITLTGTEDKSNSQVKVSFWFIDGVLDEVSYTDEATHATVAYKDLTNKSEDSSSTKAIAANNAGKNTRMN